MKNLGKIVLFVGLSFLSIAMGAEGPKTPIVALHGDTVSIDGQYAHIKGEMPLKGETWYYNVELKYGGLFEFTFWTINEFQDTAEKNYGSYEAKSWLVQVLDSKTEPETRIIFDHPNDFEFRGDLVDKGDHVEVRIDAIEGMPKSAYGPVALKALKQQ